MLIRQGENGETGDQIDVVALVNDQRHVTRLIPQIVLQGDNVMGRSW